MMENIMVTNDQNTSVVPSIDSELLTFDKDTTRNFEELAEIVHDYNFTDNENFILSEIYSEQVFGVVLDFKVNKIIQDKIFLQNESFDLEIEDGDFIISHPKWSLIGRGESILEAENNLIDEAKDLYEVIKGDQPKDVTQEFLRMRDFIFQII